MRKRWLSELPIEVKLALPPDSTFLNAIFYEGLLYLLKNGLAETPTERNTIKIDDDAFDKAFKGISKVDQIHIVMSGNDNLNDKLPKLFKINKKTKKSFRELMILLSAEHKKLYGFREKIEISLLEKKKKIYLGSGAKEDGLTAQLFKVDRYTGFSSIETPYTSTQLTMHLSKEVTLLMLLGVYSSFVTTIRSEGKDSHYFALFSPDETQKFLMEDRRFVRSCLDIREAVKERFSEILHSRVNELLSIEVSMNLSLIKQMREEKIDKLSLLLFKINKEGQTYKIYEKIPLVIYREPIFLKILERTGKHPGRILERLDKALKPDSTFFRALANRNRNDHENALRAIIGLYRFVVAEDPQGWFIFLRELTNASLKCGSEADRRSYNFVLSGMT